MFKRKSENSFCYVGRRLLSYCWTVKLYILGLGCDIYQVLYLPFPYWEYLFRRNSNRLLMMPSQSYHYRWLPVIDHDWLCTFPCPLHLHRVRVNETMMIIPVAKRKPKRMHSCGTMLSSSSARCIYHENENGIRNVLNKIFKVWKGSRINIWLIFCFAFIPDSVEVVASYLSYESIWIRKCHFSIENRTTSDSNNPWELN